jgi:hypothetical protein
VRSAPTAGRNGIGQVMLHGGVDDGLIVENLEERSPGGEGWPVEGWIVIAVWSTALLALAVFVYRRDTSRV